MLNLIIVCTSTILTYLLGLVSKKFNLNKIVPIPVQNAIVALGCFIGAFIACRICDCNISADVIAEQVFSAFGGAGLATLGYDISKSNQ